MPTISGTLVVDGIPRILTYASNHSSALIRSHGSLAAWASTLDEALAMLERIHRAIQIWDSEQAHSGEGPIPSSPSTGFSGSPMLGDSPADFVLSETLHSLQPPIFGPFASLLAGTQRHEPARLCVRVCWLVLSFGAYFTDSPCPPHGTLHLGNRVLSVTSYNACVHRAHPSFFFAASERPYFA
ncbi:hypothetical protein GY45DRAFT_1376498 [Cubamyces sp. BRFM 1775]|nr:hypothetical protein GY45DRAFT_1376498 [Cubamyces sp. BRFM 1775]